MATELPLNSFTLTVTTCSAISVEDGSDYTTTPSGDTDEYAVAVFAVFKTVVGDQVVLLSTVDDYVPENDHTGLLVSGGVLEIRSFIVPLFGGLTPNMIIGDIAYDTATSSFYKCIANDTLPSAPDASWSIMTIADESIAEFENAAFVNNQNELYYSVDKHFIDCEIENKLSDLLLEIKKDCHTACTLNNYELLRRKYEAGKAYFDLENYSKAQSIYEDTYNHLNSNGCC